MEKIAAYKEMIYKTAAEDLVKKLQAEYPELSDVQYLIKEDWPHELTYYLEPGKKHRKKVEKLLKLPEGTVNKNKIIVSSGDPMLLLHETGHALNSNIDRAKRRRANILDVASMAGIVSTPVLSTLSPKPLTRALVAAGGAAGSGALGYLSGRERSKMEDRANERVIDILTKEHGKEKASEIFNESDLAKYRKTYRTQERVKGLSRALSAGIASGVANIR